MEQEKKVCNLIIAILLTTVSIHPVSSSQNLYTLTTIGSIGNDRFSDDVSLQPLNTTTSIYQDFTTDLPVSTSIQTEEILDSAETNTLNRYAGPSRRQEEYSEKIDDSEESPDHAIPYSEHEEARNVSTRPKYVAPGVWAKPPPEKDIPLNFVPTKLHAQVRGIHTVKRLPQREAIKSAKTDEEKHNALRLREVVTNSKINTVYTEEGYEDSAYDHAGHVRDADFHEGFARKLHDQKNNKLNSSSNKKKKKDRNLVPDEFKEYEEDYQDFKENGKALNGENNLAGYDRNIWEGSEIDSKLVAENGIRKLEKDIEEDAEETERSSKNYQDEQESKLRNDIEVDDAESKESHGENDLKDEENKTDKIKAKKSKLWNKKDNTINNEIKQSSRLQKKKKNLYPETHETTAIPSDKSLNVSKILANSYGFLTNALNSRAYSVDQTTLRYVAPTATTSFRQVDDQPTTISYSQLFWNYFKAIQGPSTTESSVLFSDSTTMNPRPEERTPVALTNIDGHGPYLLMTKRDDIDYVNNVVSTVATYTSVQPLLLQSLPSLNPEDTEHSSPANLLDSTTSSSTPAVMTLNITQEAYSQIADYHENPFLGSVLDDSKILVAKNKIKYKVAIRPKSEKKSVKLIAHPTPYQQFPPPSISKKEDETQKIQKELNAKYNKMLNYIKSKQKTQSLPEKKIVFPEDLTLMRPPTLEASFSIFPSERPPVIDHHSSVFVESETPRKTNWRSLLQEDQFPSRPIELPLRSNVQPFAYVQPVRLIYRNNPLPATKLLPPPLSLTSIYANYHNDWQNDNYLSYAGGKPQQKRDNAFKYFPLVSKASWRTQFRRKRSEFRNDTAVDVKAAANNGVTNDNKLEQRDKDTFNRIIDRSKGKSANRRVIDAPIIDVPDKTRLASLARSKHSKNGTFTTLIDKKTTIANSENVKDAKIIHNLKSDEKDPISTQSIKRDGYENNINIERSIKKRNKKRNFLRLKTRLRRNTRNHEELLNESPKINSKVIDEEIDARFNDNNENSPKVEEQGKIDAEVPSFDYIEELAEDSLVEPSTTTEVVIDSKKYPFYKNKDVPSTSALKYVVDPSTIPRKTSRGMEFYDSRNAYRKCDEVESNVDEVLPEKEEPDPERGPRENLPRLRGLGDKLDCFKAKYFDENPLDNPLFAEKLIEEPTPPSELDPAKFASRIMVLPKDNEEYIVHRVSKKPERSGRQWRNRPYETHESIHINYKHDPQTGRGRNAYLHTVRGSRPSSSGHKSKNRKLKPKTSSITTQSPKTYQTPSYQNQVYEDVMGNIRNMASSYQVYEITTLPSAMQNLATADSKKTLKIANVTPNSSSEENSTSLADVIDIDDVTDVTSNTKSSEIKGLVPPPKYSAPRKTSYRKYRPPNKRKVSLRSSNLPRIIAHRHTIKINKRSTTDDNAKNSSESTINKDEKSTTIKLAKIGNDTIVKSIEEAMHKTSSMPEMLNLDIEESRQINTQGQNLSTIMKIDDKKRRRNSTNNNETSEPSHKIIYTIKDRVRYSKPKWDAGRYGKFTTISKTVDEDSRRKEPRYNYFKRKKKLDNDWRKNSTIMNSTESTFGIENITSTSTESGESSTTEVYRAEESVMHQIIYRNDKYPEREESVDVESAENVEDKTENTTNTYQVREDIDEEHGFTTTKRSTSSSNSREVLDLQKYLASDPPGYAETFSEEATTLSSKYRADINHELEDDEKKEDEETDYPKNVANSWDDDSSEKIEEQVETPMKIESSVRDDDSEELSSKEEEEEASDKDQTFFSYKKRPSSAEKEKDNEGFEKETFYRPFPFSRYKSKFKKESEEDDSEEESEERNKDYVFPWHADKEDKKDRRKWLQNFDRYEYPWEKRERQARERRRKRKQADRLRKLIFDDEDEEESTRYERPIYPWERYDVPSKTRVNTRRRDISRKYIDDSEESATERLPLAKFSSKYSSSDRVKPSKPLNAKEISRSIKKILEEDEDDKFKEKTLKKSEDRSPLFARKSLPSRGTLVPEDITQPPRKKNRRRKISQVEKNTSNNSSFDSKKLNSPGIINKEEEENPVVEYQKLNKSNVDDSESRIKTVSQLFNSTKEPSFATEPHKKYRQRISKNNSTISLNNASAEPIFEPVKKRRRKPQALKHQTSVSPSTSVDLDTSKSIFTPVRRKYSKADEPTKTNTSDSFRKSTTVKSIQTDNLEAETSTPKTRTVEHRSKVSKEKIVTKTTYPNEAESFYPANVTFAQKEPKEKLKIKSRRRKNINKQKDNNRNSNDKKKLIEEKAEERDYGIKIVNTDEIKSSAISEKFPVKNKDPVKSSEIRKDEIKKINDYNIYDGINDKNDSDNSSFWSTEVSLSSHHKTIQIHILIIT